METALIISLLFNVVFIILNYKTIIDYDKALKELNDEWYNHCTEINKSWYERCTYIRKNKTNKEK